MRKLIPVLAIGALLTVFAPAGAKAVTINASPSFATSVGEDQTYADIGSGWVSTDPGILIVDANGSLLGADPYTAAYRRGQIRSTTFQYTGPTGGSLTWSFNAVSLRQVYSPGSLQTIIGGAVDAAFISTVTVWLVADGVGLVDSQELVGLEQGTQGCFNGSLTVGWLGLSPQLCGGTEETNFPSTNMTKTLQGSQVVAGRNYWLVVSVDSRIYGLCFGLANGLDLRTTAQGLNASASWSPTSSTDAIFDVSGYYAPDTNGSSYHPIDPVRVLDTRSNLGLSGKFTDQVRTARPLQVAGARSGAIDPAATAVTGILTVVRPTAGGWLSVSSDSSPYGNTSTLNFVAGDIASNGVTVGLSSGKVYITLGAPGGQADVIFDVTGYYTAGLSLSGDTYYNLSDPTNGSKPIRVLDTRSLGSPVGKLTPHWAAMVQVVGPGLVPAGAVAITANVAVVYPTAGGWLWIGPSANSSPNTSMINFTAGDIRATGVTVGLYGSVVWVTLGTASGTADVILDVTGYFKNDGRGATFHPVPVQRLIDTRNGTGGLSFLVPHSAQSYRFGAAFGSAIAVTGNLTATNETAAGWLSLGPSPDNYPGTSTLNFPAGVNRANDVTCPLSGGSMSITYGP